MAYSKLFNQSASLAESLILSLIRLFCLYMCYFLVCHLVYPLVNWLLISWFIILGNDEFQEALKHQNSQSANDSYDDDQET